MKNLLFGLLSLLPIMVLGQITQPEYDLLNKVMMERDSSKAAKLLISVEKKYPNDAAVIYQRGFYHYFYEGDYNKALQNFSKTIKLQPDFVMAYMMRSKVLASKGIYSKAVEDISYVLKTNADVPDLLVARAEWNYAAKQYDAALVDFLKLIDLVPAEPVYYYDAANTYKNLGRKTEAEQLLQSAFIKSNVDKLSLHCLYGRFLLDEKRFKESRDQYQKAAAISISNWSAEDYNRAGIASLRSDDLVKAAFFLEKAIEADPGNINFILNRADIAIDTKDWQRVTLLAKSALAINSKHPKANMMMAVGLTWLGEKETGRMYEAKAKQYEAEQNQ